MIRRRLLALLLLALLCSAPAWAQTRIIIPAGTPEDKALQAISNEGDVQKRVAMLHEFVQQYAANPAAVAYGNWQLSQLYQGLGEPAKALEYGDKALAAMPGVVDILISQVDVAQQLKQYAKVVDYATRGATVIREVDKQPRPEGVSEPDFAAQIAEQKKALQPNHDYLETAGYNAIASEQDARQRMKEIDQYMAAFPGSKFAEQVTTLAIVTLQQLKDTAGLAAFGDKVLAKNADDMRLLTVLANAYADDPSGAYLAKAGAYARKAIELEKTQAADPEHRKLAGVAHAALGRVLLHENKYPGASAEFKIAAGLLKDSPQDRAGSLYYLGFAYAKMERAADAISALTEASGIDSPYKQPAADLLGKIKAARARPR